MIKHTLHRFIRIHHCSVVSTELIEQNYNVWGTDRIGSPGKPWTLEIGCSRLVESMSGGSHQYHLSLFFLDTFVTIASWKQIREVLKFPKWYFFAIFWWNSLELFCDRLKGNLQQYYPAHVIASASTFPGVTHRLLFHLGQKLLNTTFWLLSFRAAIPLWYTWYTFCIIILSQYRNFYFHISAIFFKWLLGHSKFRTDISGFRRGTRSDSKKDCCEVGGEVQWHLYEKNETL